jgi:hypothetical protein
LRAFESVKESNLKRVLFSGLLSVDLHLAHSLPGAHQLQGHLGDPVSWPRHIDRAIHWPSWEFTFPRQSRSLGGNLKVLLDHISARRFPIM